MITEVQARRLIEGTRGSELGILLGARDSLLQGCEEARWWEYGGKMSTASRLQ